MIKVARSKTIRERERETTSLGSVQEGRDGGVEVAPVRGHDIVGRPRRDRTPSVPKNGECQHGVRRCLKTERRRERTNNQREEEEENSRGYHLKKKTGRPEENIVGDGSRRKTSATRESASRYSPEGESRASEELRLDLESTDLESGQGTREKESKTRNHERGMDGKKLPKS